MNTPNLDKVREVPYPTPLQLAVLFYGDDGTCSSIEELQDGEDAATELTAMQARIEKLETAANKAVEWLHHYPSPDNMEEQMVMNAKRARGILEEALK